MVRNSFIFIFVLFFMVFAFASCGRSTSENMQALRETARPDAPQQKPGTPEIIPPLTQDIEKMNENTIEEQIRSIVDGFLVKGLDRSMQPMVMAEAEFEEIISIDYFASTQSCEVRFGFFLLAEEFRGQDTIESDGMVFDVSKQYKEGKAIYRYRGGEWELDEMDDMFYQINFLRGSR